MTTMLRSAAMTLLSKTLLTFLYKYLSDVDVEGIEMPSLYGSTEGPGSGWGVRLSNVKLREGAELKTLPGNKKAKPKQPKEKSKEESPIPKSEENSNNIQTPIPPEPDGSTKDSGSQTKKGSSSNGDAKTNKLSDVYPYGDRAANGRDTVAGSLSGIAGAKRGEASESRKRFNSEDTFLDEDSLSSLPDSGTPRPETPTQDSSMSFLSCFAPGSEDANQRQAIAKTVHNDLLDETKQANGKQQQQKVSDMKVEISSQEKASYPKITGMASEDGHFKPVSSEDKNLDDTARRLVDEYEGGRPKKEYRGDREDSGDDEDERDSQPMILRIGKGGYIGTLDVRLVGKELHVLVEDAFLTLEVVKKPFQDEGQAATDDGNATADATASEQKEKKTTPPAAPIDIEDLKTAGERVLASNPIARIFSSIPHLFLRDILVRLVVKSETYDEDIKEPHKDEKQSLADDDEEIDNAEVCVDFGIGLLSCTDGEDFLSPFNNDDNLSQDGGSSPPTLKTQTSQSWSTPENEFLERRIRTGKGSDGGIWMNVVTPKADNSRCHRFFNTKLPEATPDLNPRWARQVWLEATRYCVLRVSGLDIQARIFLGTKKELAEVNSSFFLSDAEAFQDIDSSLFGFDHVVPGPTPNQLPPLAPPVSSTSYDERDDFGNVMSQDYKADRNGIQSSNIPSCFYRVARGMTPTRCTLEHLPCEDCEKCWEAACKRTSETIEETHSLDSVTPMPGLTLSVSFLDPLEVNLDRVSLVGLGLVIGLLKKPNDTSEELVEVQETVQEAEPKSVHEPEKGANSAVPKATESRGYFSSFFSSRKSDAEVIQNTQSLPPAFPLYMKPENIQILGLHAAEVRLRVHVMQPDEEERHRTGPSFCFWDARIECLTFDQQKLTSDEKIFQDLRIDAAIVEMHEFKGTEQKIMLSTGTPYPELEGENLPLSSAGSSSNSKRPQWPTTASALLDVHASFESQIYESRERHGLQFRMLEVTEEPCKAAEKCRGFINCQLGAAEIKLPWPVAAAFREVKDEISKSLFPVPEDVEDEAEESTADDAPTDTAKQYRFQFGGGRVALGSMINVRMPLTRLAGDICPESGFSMETLIERAELSYGTSSKKLAPTANTAIGFSLRRLTSLPENVRLRILLFVDNLEPMERALQVKKQSNSFLRCSAVNKALGKIAAKKIRKKTAPVSGTKMNRRQELMNKLLTLDDSTLESLWAHHQKKGRKAKKKA